MSAALLACVIGVVLVRGLWRSAEPALVLTVSAALLVLPQPVNLCLLALCAVCYLALYVAGRLKVAMTGQPLFPIDLKLALRDPGTVARAVGISPTAASIVAVSVCAGAGTLVVWSVASARNGSDPFTHLLARVAASLVLVGTALLLSERTYRVVTAHFRAEPYPFGSGVIESRLQWSEPVSLWTPSFNATLASHLGVLSFLLLKLRRERANPAPLVRLRRSSRVPLKLDECYRQSLAAELPLLEAPDVVVVQLESICNPNWAFDLAHPFESRLFEKNEYSHFVTPLRVNIVGGGTWVSEFELVTGLDTRLFGDDGLYSHVLLPRFIKQAFPAYMRARGWKTLACIPTLKSFYNSERAFHTYGFDVLMDAAELAVHEWDSTDMEMIDAFMRVFPSASPFFAYIGTNGAHSPFRDVNGPEPIERVFQREATDAADGLMRRYFKLLRTSETAVMALLGALAERKQRLGRDFVLLIYGDHQPWELVTGKRANLDRLRKPGAQKNVTFAHLMSSQPAEHPMPTLMPLTLMPTLLSGFVTRQVDDLYLPVNLLFQQAFGANVFSSIAGKAPLRPFRDLEEQIISFHSEQPTADSDILLLESALACLRDSSVLRS